jgi:pyruvate kinase
LDTKGPEIRSGFFANDAKKVDLVKGETLILTADYHFKGDKHKLACSYPSLATSVSPGQQILVADGSLVLTVLSTDPSNHEVSCRIENNTSMGERKNMNLPGVQVDLPTFTEKDVNDIVAFGIARKVRNCFAVCYKICRNPFISQHYVFRPIHGVGGIHCCVVCPEGRGCSQPQEVA